MGTDKARAFAAAKKLNAMLMPTNDLVARVAGGGNTVADAFTICDGDGVPVL